MKKFALAAAMLPLALSACSGDENGADAPSTVASDDNDAAEPAPGPSAEQTPHDESVPHEH
jgi:hypothetical protein